MGGSESKSGGEDLNGIKVNVDFKEENLKFLRQLDDPKYGQCKVFKSEELDYQIALVTRSQQKHSEADFQEVLASYQQISKLRHNAIIQLLKYSAKKKSELCSSHFAINIYFEYAGNNLENDMKRRQGNGLFYEESELWHIIVQVVAGVAFLDSRGISHGDIQPSSLLLNNKGQVKILPIPIAQTASRLNNYMQAFMGMKKAKYLSPKLLLALEQQNQCPVHDTGKSDAFSLGLVILEAALLQDQDDIYNYEEFEFNLSILDIKLQYVKEKYSQNLYEFLRSLLVQDEMDRLTIKQHFKIIEQLCIDGVQMSDCIFSSNFNDRVPTYNFSIDAAGNGFVSSGGSMSIRFDSLITEQEDIIKRGAIHFQDDEVESDINLPGHQHTSHRPIMREEKVRRSKWTLSDNASMPSAGINQSQQLLYNSTNHDANYYKNNYSSYQPNLYQSLSSPRPILGPSSLLSNSMHPLDSYRSTTQNQLQQSVQLLQSQQHKPIDFYSKNSFVGIPERRSSLLDLGVTPYVSITQPQYNPSNGMDSAVNQYTQRSSLNKYSVY